MNLGSFEVPEARLLACMGDTKTLYEAVGSQDINSGDVAQILGYKANTTSSFYRRLNSMTLFDLVERRGKYRVTELGKGLAYPENDETDKRLRKRAVLKVPLWNELFRKFSKNPPEDVFWVHLKNITGIEAPLAKEVQNQVRKWYIEDVLQISDDLLNVEEEPNKFSSVEYNDIDRRPMMSSQSVANPSEEFETINFNKVTIQLPKHDIKKWWESAKVIVDEVLKHYATPIQETSKETMKKPTLPTTEENTEELPTKLEQIEEKGDHTSGGIMSQSSGAAA